MNIQIMRTFVQLRDLIASNAELALRLDALEQRYDGQFRRIFDAIREIMSTEKSLSRRTIGFGRETQE